MDNCKPWRLSPFIAVQNPNPRAAENWLILGNKTSLPRNLDFGFQGSGNQEPPGKTEINQNKF